MAKISSLLTTLLEIHGEVKKKLDSDGSEESFYLSVGEMEAKWPYIEHQNQNWLSVPVACIF